MKGQEASNLSKIKIPSTVINRITNKFTTDKLLMILDKDKLVTIEKQFQGKTEGIQLNEFVWLMMWAMNVPEEDKYDLVLGISKLFSDINIADEKSIAWSKITQYILDAFLIKSSKNDEKPADQEEMLERAHMQKFVSFGSGNVIDKCLHQGNIQYMIYSEFLNEFVAAETFSDKISLFTLNGKNKETIDVPFDKKAFVLSVAVDDEKKIIACSGSDKTIYYFEMKNNKFKCNRKQKFDQNQYGLWFLKYHKLWVGTCDSGENNLHLIQVWKLREVNQHISISGKLSKHTNLIKEIIEILNPFSIVSCGLDNLIFIWEIENDNIFELEKHHNSGVVCLDYSPEYGGNIISVGYEKYINVWSPEVSISKSHIGILAGHNTTVLQAKFIKKSPIVISVDNKYVIRIWDIRNLICKQIINNIDSGSISCSGLLTIKNQKRFIIYGRRILYFDTSNAEKNPDIENKISNSNIPLFAFLNNYFHEIYVVTLADIRSIELKKGQLIKVNPDIKDSFPNSELTAFDIDDKDRKIYIGNSNGFLKVYNIGNGKLIKTISDNKHSYFQQEISGIVYVNEDKILIVTSREGKIIVFDEQFIDNVVKIREILGGSLNSEIVSLAFCRQNLLIACGLSNGLIPLFDYETSKLENICIGSNFEVLSLSFIKGYPLLLSTYSDGSICLWKLKTQSSSFICIFRMFNFSFNDMNYQTTPVHTIYSASMLPLQINEESKYLYNELSDIEEVKKIYMNNIKEENLTHKIKMILHDIDDSSKNFKFKGSNSTSRKEINSNDPEILELEFYQRSEKKEISKSFKNSFGLNFPILEKEYKTPNMEIPKKSESLFFPMISNNFNSNFNSNSDSNFNQINKEGNSESPNKPISNELYLFLGDDLGNIKALRLTQVISVSKVDPFPIDSKINSNLNLNLNPRRKESVDVTIYAKHYLKDYQFSKIPIWIVENLNGFIISSIKAHEDSIIQLRYNKFPQGFISTSKDKSIKIWDRDLNLKGHLKTEGKNSSIFWNFQYPWDQVQDQNKKEIVKILDRIEEYKSHKEDEIIFSDYLDESPIYANSEKKLNPKKKKNNKNNNNNNNSPIKIKNNNEQLIKNIPPKSDEIEDPSIEAKLNLNIPSQSNYDTDTYKKIVTRILNTEKPMLPGIGNTLKKYLNEYQNAKSEREKGKIMKSGLEYSSKISSGIKSELLPINVNKYTKNYERNASNIDVRIQNSSFKKDSNIFNSASKALKASPKFQDLKDLNDFKSKKRKKFLSEKKERNNINLKSINSPNKANMGKYVMLSNLKNRNPLNMKFISLKTPLSKSPQINNPSNIKINDDEEIKRYVNEKINHYEKKYHI